MADLCSLVVALTADGRIVESSYECAALAREYARRAGGTVRAAALGAKIEAVAGEFARKSGLETVALHHPSLESYTAEGRLAALAILLREQPATAVFIPHTAEGWDFAPALAARLGGDCVTGVSALSDGDPPGLVRPILSGKLLATAVPDPARTTVVTVLAGAAKPMAAEAAGAVSVRELDLLPARTRNRGCVKPPPSSLDLGRARVIVAAGRGLGGPEKLELVRELAGCFERSAIGASRPVVDAGWLPLEHQVGQTGQTVRPRLYLALGISGAMQHTAGMKDSELIVAVNRDRGASIFKVAHLGVVADLHRFVPILIEALRARRG